MGTRTRNAVALAGLALAALAVFWLARTDPLQPADQAPALAAEAAATEPAQPASATAAPPAPPTPPTPPTPDTPATDPDPSARLEVHGDTSAALAGNLTVVVVDSDSKQPVPHARLEVSDLRALLRALAEAGTALHEPAGRDLRAQLAIVTTTDAAGETSLRAPPVPLLIEARLGPRWGMATLNELPDSHRVVVTIGPDRDLQVQVLDEGGRPRADVPVSLRHQIQSEPRRRWAGQHTLSEAPDGLARFQHLQRRLRQGSGWHATFTFPCREQPVAPVDETTPHDPPLQLILPPTGSLRIRVRAPDVEPALLEGLGIRLAAFADGRELWEQGPWSEPPFDDEARTAIAPWLGLGLELRVELLRAGTVLATRQIPGPRHPGEVAECEFGAGDLTIPLARGRFVRNDGRAWPACTASAFAMLQPTPLGAPPAQNQPLAVDADGRFTLEVRDARPPDGSRTYRFHAPHPDGTGSASAFVPLNQDIPPPGLDLGDIRLDHGPLLVAGRVVDHAHQPVQGAQMQLQASTTVLSRVMHRHVYTSGIARTRADGSFALYLPPGELDPGAQLRLLIRCEGYVPILDHDCTRGDDKVVILLEPESGLAGSIQIGDGIESSDVIVRLAAAATGASRDLPVRPDGTFSSNGIRADTYSLRVLLRGPADQPEPRPAFELHGLVLLPRVVNRDPRIQQIRLESRHPALRIEVVDRSSTPLQRATVTIAGVRGSQPALTDAAGVCRLRVERLPVDLEVTAFGHRTRRLPGVTTDQRVVLERGIPVRLQAGARAQGADPKYRLGVMLFEVDDAGIRRGMVYDRSYPWQRRYFESDGTLAVELPHAGVYECDLFVYVEGADHVGRGGPVTFQPRPRITVVDTAVVQTFAIDVPQTAVDEAARVTSR